MINKNIIFPKIKPVEMKTDKIRTASNSLQRLKNQDKKIDELQTKSYQIEKTNVTNQSQLDAIEKDISNFKHNFSVIDTNFDNLFNTVSEIDNTNTTQAEQISVLFAKTNGNATRIEALEPLQSRTVQIRKDLSALQTKHDTDISDLTRQIEILKQPVDDSYHPKTYSDFPAGTILKTYDFFEMEMESTEIGALTLPIVCFCAEAESEGTLKIKFNYKYAVDNLELLVTVLLNGESLLQDKITVENATEWQTYQKSLDGITLNKTAKANMIKIMCQPTYTKAFSINYVKVELFAPNADLINKQIPYDVEIINGYYYITDCSTGTAKIAHEKFEDVKNIDALQFETTTYKAKLLVVGQKCKSYNSTYVLDDIHYIYRGWDNHIHSYSFALGNDYRITDQFISFDWLPNRNTVLNIAITNSQNDARTMTLMASNTNYTTYTTQNSPKNFAINHAFKPFTSILKHIDYRYPLALVDLNGEVWLYSTYASDRKTISLGYGTNIRAYYKNYKNENSYDLSVFVTKFDKIVNYNITFLKTADTPYTINSTTEIGSYDDYFEGANNDYFVVKGGKLQHYLKPTTNDSSENTNANSTNTN
ncbi:MAG TPA: hypothetical protein DCZ34_02340 [Clostridiales bacterium]|nr:hypothetical protein [Clostridiales bacterium]